jgi:hypothetical protein
MTFLMNLNMNRIKELILKNSKVEFKKQRIRGIIIL